MNELATTNYDKHQELPYQNSSTLMILAYRIFLKLLMALLLGNPVIYLSSIHKRWLREFCAIYEYSIKCRLTHNIQT